MFEHILVPLDGSSLAECVLPYVVATALPFDANVTLLNVCERTPAAEAVQPLDTLNWQLKKAESEAYLVKVAGQLREAGLRVDSRSIQGKAAEQIVAFAHQHDADLIIASSHGKSGLTGWNVSSVGQKIISRAGTSLMIIRAYRSIASRKTELRYRRLLVPLDCSLRSEHVLPVATILARYHHSHLTLAHVVPVPDMPRRRPLTQEERQLIDRVTELNQTEAAAYLQEVTASLPALPTGLHTQLVVSRSAAQSLHELVEELDVDLVLLSAHGGFGGSKWPYGGLAINFIIHGTTPLLVLQDLSPQQIEPGRAQVAAGEHRGH